MIILYNQDTFPKLRQLSYWFWSSEKFKLIEYNLLTEDFLNVNNDSHIVFIRNWLEEDLSAVNNIFSLLNKYPSRSIKVIFINVVTSLIIDKLPETSYLNLCISKFKKATNPLSVNIQLNEDELYLQIIFTVLLLDSQYFSTIRSGYYSLTNSCLINPKVKIRDESLSEIIKAIIVRNSVSELYEFVGIPKQLNILIDNDYRKARIPISNKFSTSSFKGDIGKTFDSPASGKLIQEILRGVKKPKISEDFISLGDFKEKLYKTLYKIGYSSESLIFDYDHLKRNDTDTLNKLVDDFEKNKQSVYDQKEKKNFIYLGLIFIITLAAFLLFATWKVGLLAITVNFVGWFLLYLYPRFQFQQVVKDFCGVINAKIQELLKKYLVSDKQWIENYVRTLIERELEIINPKITQIENYFDGIPPTKIWEQNPYLKENMIPMIQFSEKDKIKFVKEFVQNSPDDFRQIFYEIESVIADQINNSSLVNNINNIEIENQIVEHKNKLVTNGLISLDRDNYSSTANLAEYVLFISQENIDQVNISRIKVDQASIIESKDFINLILIEEITNIEETEEIE